MLRWFIDAADYIVPGIVLKVIKLRRTQLQRTKLTSRQNLKIHIRHDQVQLLETAVGIGRGKMCAERLSAGFASC